MAATAAPTITVTPLQCGQLISPATQPGEPRREVVPVTAYLLGHPSGTRVAFDTGLGPRFARPVGEQLSGTVDLEEDGLIDARLWAIDVDPGQIAYILNSHLHSTHAGGNALLPAASVIVQALEWEHACAANELDYHPPEFNTGQTIIKITGEHDVFGDGSVVLMPTPGHTPGHQSARVRTRHGEMTLAG